MERKVLKVAFTTYIVITALVIYATAVPQDQSKTASSFEGSYTVTANNPNTGIVEFGLKLKKTGDKWGGEMSSTQFQLKLTDVTIDGENNIIMKCDTEVGPIEIKGRFADDKFTGTYEGSGMNGTWEAVKKKPDQ